MIGGWASPSLFGLVEALDAYSALVTRLRLEDRDANQEEATNFLNASKRVLAKLLTTAVIGGPGVPTCIWHGSGL
jgi:hypothetical protein